jgi:hypothetical protein
VSQWYYSKDGKSTQGPVTLDALKNMVALGQLQPNSLVQQEGAGKWVRVKNVKELDDPGPTHDVPEELNDAEPLARKPRGRGAAKPSAAVSTGEADPWQFKAMRVCAVIAMILGILVFLGMMALGIFFFIEITDRRGFRAEALLPVGTFALGSFLCLYAMLSTAVLLYFWVEVGRTLRDIRRVVLQHDRKNTA